MPINERVAADLPVTIKIADYTLLPDDFGREIQFQSASDITAYLLGVADAGNGYNVIIRNIGTGTLTIAPASTELIDGTSTASLATGGSLWIRSDGTEWKSIATNGSGGGGGGGVQVIATESFSSNLSEVTFTDLDSIGVASWQIDFIMHPAGNNEYLQMQVSTGSGSSPTFETSNYAWNNGGARFDQMAWLNRSQTAQSAMSIGEFQTTNWLGTNTGEGIMGRILFFPQSGDGGYFRANWHGTGLGVDDYKGWSYWGGGTWLSVTAVKAVRFALSSGGNMAQGEFTLSKFVKA